MWFAAPGALMVCLAVGCLSLDPFLFKEEQVSEYEGDSYTGETECSDAIAWLGQQGSPEPEVKEITIPSGSETIYGQLLTDSTNPAIDTLIVYFHGTTAHIDYYWPRTRLLFAVGLPVLTIDYRGYGRSSGEPSEDGINEDGNAALEFVRDSLGGPAVIVCSYSLGSLVGCHLASTDATGQIVQVILEAPIGSVQTLVEDGSYLNLPGSYATTFTGDNCQRIGKVLVPLLWLHGTEDETLNRETNGLRVWESHGGDEGCYIKAIGAGHQTIPQTIGYDTYIRALRDFVRNSPAEERDAVLNCK